MDEAQVRDSFNAWVAEHPNGKMKPKDFREMMGKALPSKDASKMEKHVFRIYDANNDGYIDFIEFMIIFHIMSEGAPKRLLAKYSISSSFFPSTPHPRAIITTLITRQF